MTIRTIVLLAVCQSDAKLEGVWRVLTNESVTYGRQDEATNTRLNYTLTITQNRFIWKARGDVDEVEYKIVSDTKPQAIDLILDGKTANKCIFEIQGDTLRLCIAHGSEKRPEKFAPAKTASLLVLKRKKP